jgi:phosphoglycerol transferase MdoB-like AlkP superfamily enzyme
MLYLSGRFFLAAMLLLTFSRLCLCAWQWPRVRDAGGLWPVLFGGWRIDLSFVSMVTAFPALLAPWLGHLPWAVTVAAWWFGLWWFVLVLLEISTPQFILEYDSRPNRLFVEYLVHPREVSSMLWRGYKAMLFGGVLALAVLVWLGVHWMNGHDPDPLLGWWQRALLFVVLFVALFLAGRGTLGHRPLNAAQVAFSSDAMVNMLPLCGAFVVANAIMAMRADKPASAVYGKLPEPRMQAVVRACAGLADPPLDPQLPTLHRQPASAPAARPRNLVIVIEESLGAQFVGCLGGQPLTPELDALAGEGWLLERLYATGTRSVRGLEAVLTGFLPTPAEAVVKLPRSQRDFFTLAALLGRHGYRSRFIYGGEAHFDNMKGFFLGNGFDEVIDQPRFKLKPSFVGSWGACDEDMFNELHQRLLDDDGAPTLSVAFSVTNHTPWEYPTGRIEPQGDPASVDNTVRYADWAIGRFFERAKQSPYWENTVFLVVADHDARVRGASLVPVRHFHIPALILGAGVPARRDPRLASQIDLSPTLLSLAGVDSVHPMPGADLTARDPGRAIMQYGDNFGYLKGDTLLVMEPERPATQFAYRREGEVLTPQAVDTALAEEALAHALWPGWAYFNQRYRLPPA